MLGILRQGSFLLFTTHMCLHPHAATRRDGPPRLQTIAKFDRTIGQNEREAASGATRIFQPKDRKMF
jgi:hypothetical protein